MKNQTQLQIKAKTYPKQIKTIQLRLEAKDGKEKIFSVFYKTSQLECGFFHATLSLDGRGQGEGDIEREKRAGFYTRPR